MIQKRYQHYAHNGIEWTPWLDFENDDTQLPRLQSEEKWQSKGKLLNEYRLK